MANGETNVLNWIVKIGGGVIGLMVVLLGWFYADKAKAYEDTLIRIESKVDNTDTKVETLQELISGQTKDIGVLIEKAGDNEEDIAECKEDIKEIERRMR